MLNILLEVLKTRVPVLRRLLVHWSLGFDKASLESTIQHLIYTIK